MLNPVQRYAVVFACASLLTACSDHPGSGTLDDSFGSKGVVRLDGEMGTQVTAVHTQGDNILVGLSGAVIRLENDGSVDSSFGVDGTAVLPFRGPVNAILTDSHDRLVVAGVHSSPGQTNTAFAVARLSAAGVIDLGFGDSGLAAVDLSEGPDEPRSLSISTAGIVAAGDVGFDRAGAVRLTDDGRVDSSFADAGVLRSEVSGASWVVDREGLLIVSGSPVSNELTTVADPRDGTVIAWYDQAGRPLSERGSGGAVRLPENLRVRAVDAHGNLLAVREVQEMATVNHLELVRLRGDGKPDPAFGEQRLEGLTNGAVVRIVVQASGPIYVIGFQRSGPAVVQRYAANGSGEDSYGSDGQGAIGTALTYAEDAVMQKDGKVIVGGSMERPGARDPRAFVARLR